VYRHDTTVHVNGSAATTGEMPHFLYFELLPLGGTCTCFLLFEEMLKEKWAQGGTCTCILLFEEKLKEKWAHVFVRRNCLRLSLAPAPCGETLRTYLFFKKLKIQLFVFYLFSYFLCLSILDTLKLAWSELRGDKSDPNRHGNCVDPNFFAFAKYVGNSISKLQIQFGTYVFELSAGNCHR